MHWVQAIVAPIHELQVAHRRFSALVVCPLSQGFALVPVTQEVEAQLAASPIAASDQRPALQEELALGIAALAAELSLVSPVVYAATYLHGGTGGQDAVVWKDGQLALHLSDDENNMSQWPDSPISRALRYIGVKTAEGEDEFDALGLGRYRSNEDWARAHKAA
jgi:hypothetical protein